MSNIIVFIFSEIKIPTTIPTTTTEPTTFTIPSTYFENVKFLCKSVQVLEGTYAFPLPSTLFDVISYSTPTLYYWLVDITTDELTLNDSLT